MKNSSENNSQNGSLKNRVSALFELMKSEKLEELELRDEDFYLHIKRKGSRRLPVSYVHEPVAASIEPITEATVGDTIKSPITGIFYRAPSPTASSFIKESDVAEVGKTLCIVEAMKVMNEIKAVAKVRILKILVENGKPVTAEQDLFLVEKL